jgi:hypothetical protein
LGDSSFVIAGRFKETPSFEFLHAVRDDYSDPGKLEHLQVIVVITDGHHFLAPNRIGLSKKLESRPL